LNLHPLYKDQNATQSSLSLISKAKQPPRPRLGTTREQAFDHENTGFHESAVKTKGLVSAAGIEPSTYWFSISNPQINGFNGFPSMFVVMTRQN
jgi:hypothetical protein